MAAERLTIELSMISMNCFAKKPVPRNNSDWIHLKGFFPMENVGGPPRR